MDSNTKRDFTDLRYVKKTQLKPLYKKFDYHHQPINASYSKNQSYIADRRKTEINATTNFDFEHLTYDEMIFQRERDDNYRRLNILKRVIK